MDLQCHKIYSLTFLLLYMMRVGLFMYPEQRIKALCVSLICPPIIMRRKLSSNKLPQAHTQATPFKKCTGRQKDEGRGEATKSFLSRHPQASQKALHRESLRSWRKQNSPHSIPHFYLNPAPSVCCLVPPPWWSNKEYAIPFFAPILFSVYYYSRIYNYHIQMRATLRKKSK